MNDKPFYKRKSFWSYVVGIILIYPISNGIWELLYKPYVSEFGNIILNILTFGITALQDSIYQDIAKGMRERSSTELLMLLLGGITSATVIVIFGSLMFKQVDKIYDSHWKQVRQILSLFVIIMATFIFFSGLRIAYIDNKVVRFEQLYTIDAPYLTEREQLTIKSGFAQIRNKNEYYQVMEKLSVIANANKLYIPAEIN